MATPEKVKAEEVQKALKFLRDEGYIVNIWHKDGINSRFNKNCPFEDDPKLTEDELEDVVSRLEDSLVDPYKYWKQVDKEITYIIEHREE